MANEPKKSDSGVFVDTKTGKVVEKEPEEGVQLVPPGGVIDAEAQRVIDAHEAVAAGESDDKTVTTQSAKGK